MFKILQLRKPQRAHTFLKQSNNSKALRTFLALTAILSLIPTPTFAAQSPSTPWQAEFQEPPHSSKPLTWWHWISGNITKDGITRDLEWMKTFGLGGAIVFNVSRLPDEVPRKVPFNSEDWWSMADHAIAEATRLGLKLGFHNCDGWSHSGGPWILPEDSMKKLVWTETPAKSGQQNITLVQPETRHNFYRDVAVLALPTGGPKRIDEWEIKAGHTGQLRSPSKFNTDGQGIDDIDTQNAIAPHTIIDLTNKLDSSNRLDWTPPSGEWRILRIGYTTTGKTNNPSTVEGRGLESDKLDPAALRKHWGNFMGRLAEREVNQGNDTLAYSQIDSWESGIQNWTPHMETIFQELNGYSMRAYLPVLAGGNIVGSYEISERFLWDWRKTIAHQLAEACFKTLADLATADGLTTFSEGSGRGQYMYDPINYQAAGGIPQGEFWVGDPGRERLADPSLPMSPRIDCKVAASVAHIYGGQLAASESFTGANGTMKMGPYDLKMLGDQAFAIGINHIVLHTSTHQPYSHLKPGFALGNAGTHFHRNNIAFTASDAWPRYIARCQFLLRQGLYIADVLHFTGEDIPNYVRFRDELPVPLPEGYEYDACNADILLEHSRVENGIITLDSGMRYRALLLPDSPTMSLELLNRIKKLVSDGATVIGPRPQRAPGLKQFPRQDQQVAQISAQVWGDCDGVSVKEHRYGKGRVIWGKSFEEIFADLNLPPDFAFEFTGDRQPNINFIHRQDGDTEIYFLANALPATTTITARFRVSGKTPHLYFPDSGQILSTAQYRDREGIMELPITLDPYGSLFVVFTSESQQRSISEATGPTPPRISYGLSKSIEAEFFAPGDYALIYSDGAREEIPVSLPEPLALDGSWDIRFPMTKIEPHKTVRSGLFSWHDSNDLDIRYFSGTAVYSKIFNLPPGYRREGQKLYLDLGEVQKIANVRINGKPCPDLWKPPYQAEISGLLATGSNRIEIEVTNTWTNRLIGDAHLPQDLVYQPDQKQDLRVLPKWLDGSVERQSERQIFSNRVVFDKDEPLQPSGLLGPVTIKASAVRTLTKN